MTSLVAGQPTGVVVALLAGACLVLIRAGVSLARSGDDLARLTGWGGLLVGSVLVAAATSLPELVTDVAAAAADRPGLAVGDLLGSSMANMAVLAVLDLLHRRRVWPAVELAHAKIASVAIGLTGLTLLAVLTPTGLRLGWVGLDTLAIGAAYVGAVTWLRRSPTRGGPGPTPAPLPRPPGDTGRTVRGAAGVFLVAALLVLVSGPVVAVTAGETADRTGVSATFLGVALVALATSLPELAVSLAAVRAGAYTLAVGNLLGSNAANVALLPFVDAAYTRGPLLAAVGPQVAVAAAGAVVLMALALAAIVQGTETRLHRLEPDAVLLLLAYVGAVAAVATV